MNTEDHIPTAEEMEDLYEEETAGEDSQENVASNILDKQIPRGANFRQSLLKRIPPFQYPDELKQEDFNLKIVLSPLFNLKADDFIEPLRKIIPEEK